MPIKLIVGLQNPGETYSTTRHNAGAWFANATIDEFATTPLKVDKKLNSSLGQIDVQNQCCRILLPMQFMNLNGNAVRTVAQFYQIKPEEILIAHDDLDLEPGRIKLKTGGGHGGHNGLRDVIKQLGSADFHRLRIGIGHPGHKDLVHQYVLNKPSQHDRLLILDAIQRALTVLPQILSDKMQLAMTNLNS